MTTLPRPTVTADVKTSPESGKPFTAGITISRGSQTRSYTGESATSVDGAVSDAVGKVLSDPCSAEWLPEPKKD